MADLAIAHLEVVVNSLLEKLNQSCLRKLQGDMHRCSAKCCDHTSLSTKDVHRCVESCSGPFTKAETYVQNEMTNFQDIFQRCVMQCQEENHDKITSATTKSQAGVFKKDFKTCVVKCGVTHIELISSLTERMKDMLSSNPTIETP